MTRRPPPPELTPAPKPELVVHQSDLPATVDALRGLFKLSKGNMYERARKAVELVEDANGNHYIKEMVYLNVIMAAHELCQPVKITDKDKVPITLPENVAKMYLAGSCDLCPLAGITSGPLLRDDGSVITERGYDAVTGMYVDADLQIELPDRPTDQQAMDALMLLRRAFSSFPFVDAKMVRRGALDYVDLDHKPGLDESSLLTALLTAVARASLWLAPGVIINAPQTSGSGVGKGLLASAVAMIALGQPTSPVTAGHNREETDKRIDTELLSGRSWLQVDNVNARTLSSETLASALTERPIRIRNFGELKSNQLNGGPMIVVTGNGVTVLDDLARRLVHVNIDAKLEDPEDRPFQSGFLDQIREQRVVLLSAALTILRWGRQQTGLGRGMAAGSYEVWAEWVRDPLLALGCKDAVLGMRRAKLLDPNRRFLTELFDEWWQHHRNDAVRVSELHAAVTNVLDPHNNGRQWQVAKLSGMDGMRHGGYVLTRSVAGGQRSVATYRLENVSTSEDTLHDPHDPHDFKTLVPGEEREVVHIGGVPNHADHADHAGRMNGKADDLLQRYADPAYIRRRQAEQSRRAAEYERSKRRPPPVLH